MYSIIAFFLSIPVTFAAGGTTIPTTPNTPITSVEFEGPFQGESIETVLRRLAGYVQAVGAAVATIMILYGAFQILTSRGNVEQMKSGRKTIIYALGGLFVILLATGLVDVFKGLVDALGI